MKPGANGMLVVAGTGRNVGKTTMICELLHTWGVTTPISVVKITVCKKTDKPYTQFDTPFALEEYAQDQSGTDTDRFLEAGAAHAWWLRVRPEQVSDGITALMERLDTEHPIICESNNIRTIITPDVCIMMQDRDPLQIKDSAQAILPLIDRSFVFDKSTCCRSAEDISLAQGKWQLKSDATAIIMAGGTSQRMGQDKSLMCIDNTTVIERLCAQLTPLFDTVMISANETQDFDFLNLPVITDKEADRGPVMGLISALSESQTEYNFFVSCDTPMVNTDCLYQLMRSARTADAAIIRDTDKQLHPLFGVYHRRVAATAQTRLAQGRSSMHGLVDAIDCAVLDLEESDWLININTQKEFTQYYGACAC